MIRRSSARHKGGKNSNNQNTITSARPGVPDSDLRIWRIVPVLLVLIGAVAELIFRPIEIYELIASRMGIWLAVAFAFGTIAFSVFYLLPHIAGWIRDIAGYVFHGLANIEHDLSIQAWFRGTGGASSTRTSRGTRLLIGAIVVFSLPFAGWLGLELRRTYWVADSDPVLLHNSPNREAQIDPPQPIEEQRRFPAEQWLDPVVIYPLDPKILFAIPWKLPSNTSQWPESQSSRPTKLAQNSRRTKGSPPKKRPRTVPYVPVPEAREVALGYRSQSNPFCAPFVFAPLRDETREVCGTIVRQHKKQH